MHQPERADLVNYRFHKASETFKEIEVQTHSAVRQMFGLYFVKTGLISKNSGKFFTLIYDMRQTGDYDDYTDYTAEVVNSLIEPTQKLIKEVGSLLGQILYASDN